MGVDPSSALPLYAQIEGILATSIETGELLPGTQLPPEAILGARFSVSRATIRATIQNLTRRGLIEIRRGRGTYVVEPKMTQALNTLTGFVEDMQILGRYPTARLLDQEVVPASHVVATQLGLAKGTEVVRIRRVRLADGTPVSLDETYLPREIGLKIMANDLELEPIFALLEQKYNLPLIEADYRLEAIAANTDMASALQVSLGSPIFLVERTSYCAGRHPIDYERIYYRGDQIRFVTRLARRSATRANEP